MRSAIAPNGSFFNTERMVTQYQFNAYSPEEPLEKWAPNNARCSTRSRPLLRSAAEQTKADLLVVGRCPSSGRLRANAYAIIRESPVPVLSV